MPVTPARVDAPAVAVDGVLIRAPLSERACVLLSPAALSFVARLERAFGGRRRELLAHRARAQERLDRGWRPDFLPATRALRADDWKVLPYPPDLADRRVEITGPVERKMIINALNSGASVFMADFEDANSPTWENTIEGQVNLFDAVRRRIEFVAPDTGKVYRLAERSATLMVRPRGWHLVEKHVWIDGQPASAALFDFALFFFHNARETLARGSGPYFYLPKLESHLEARLWNDVFLAAQEALAIPRGSIKATVLIETILAAFEMDEILWELREHSAGLNCGRWDYIFSFIKKLRADPACVLPDRGSVGMDRPFLAAYSALLVRTCHRRGIHAMGGMAAQIPIKDDAERNHAALDKVRADKEREARNGHDGTWVAHPGLIPVARAVFDAHMPTQHQIHVAREDVRVSAADLLAVPQGAITLAGLRQNLNVGLRYLEAWLSGSGCVPIFDLMEDAATAEISRTQIWQWRRHGARLDDGRTVDAALIEVTLREELEAIRTSLGHERCARGRFDLASRIFRDLVLKDELEDFLTLVAYPHL
jgi:malate synthase